MKKIKMLLLLIPMGFFACNNSQSENLKTEKADKIEQEEIVPEETVPEKIVEEMPVVKVQLFQRTDVFYDSEGYPVEEGIVSEVKGFNDTKKFKKKKEYEFVERIVVNGNSENITIEISNKANGIFFKKENIKLNGKISFGSSTPLSEEPKDYDEKINWTRFELNTLKVFYKDNLLFEGVIDLR